MAKNEVKVKITGDAADLAKALGTGEKQLGGFASKADQMGAKMQKVGAAATIGVTAPLIAMGASSVKAFMEAEQAQAQLEASLKSTGATAWTSVDQIDALASSMQDKLAIDGDLVKSGASVLLTFTNVKNAVGEGNDVFDQATLVAADMSAKLGTDLVSANMLLGKALNDPIKGMGALRKAGVQLSEAQQEQVKQFVAVGDVMSAQKIILGELETQFGGSAEAFAGTAAGKLEAAKLQFEDVQEEIGGKLIPVLSKLGDFVSGALDGWDKLGNSGQNVVLVMAGIAAAAGPVSTVVGTVMRLGDQLGSLKGKLVETTTSADGTTRSLTNTGKAAAGAGIALGVLASIAIADEIRRGITNQADGLTSAMEDMKIAAKGGTDEVLTTFSRLAGSQSDNFFTEIPQVFGKNIKIMPELAKETIEDIEGAFESMTLGEQKAVLAALDDYGSGLERGSQAAKDNAGLVDNLTERYERNAGAAEAVASEQSEIAGTGGDATAAMEALGGAAAETTENFESVQAALDQTNTNLAMYTLGIDMAAAGSQKFAEAAEKASQLDDAISNASQLGTVMRGFDDSIKNLPKDIDQTKLALGGYNEEQQKSIDALVAAGDANTQYLTGLVAQGASSEEVAFRADVLRQEYLKQAGQLGLNDAQTQAYIETLGLTPEDVTTAIRLSELAAAQFKITAYQGLINSTPAEKLTNFNAAIARGDYIAAAAALDELARPRTVSVSAQMTPQAWATLSTVRAGFRADGGPVSKGMPYIVGEEGPELIFPERNGRVITAAETAAMVSSGGSSRPVAAARRPTPAASPVVVNIDMRGSVAPTDSAFDTMVVKAVERGVRAGQPMPATTRAVAASVRVRR